MTTSSLDSQFATLACTRCFHELRATPDGAECVNCGNKFGRIDGLLDFAPEIPVTRARPGDPGGQTRMEDPQWTRDYVKRYRKIFVSLMGGILPGSFTHDDEDAYLRKSLRSVEGPVLDLACGPGRWTRTVASVVGAERTLGLDLSVAMLTLARETLPEVLFVRGTALRMPFSSGTLGAVVVWNALQTLPEPSGIVAEIGRCLRPGGLFTCFTYRKSHSPYRLIQAAWEPIPGVHAFEPAALRQWLDAAGMALVDVSGPNLIHLFTAEKRR